MRDERRASLPVGALWGLAVRLHHGRRSIFESWKLVKYTKAQPQGFCKPRPSHVRRSLTISVVHDLRDVFF